MRVAYVPTSKIEISEEENDQSRGERRLDAGAPYPFGFVLEAENLPPEAEVDAHIGEHRPGQGGGGRKDHRPADDKDNGQKEREKAGDADHDALIEGEARLLVLVGVGLP